MAINTVNIQKYMNYARVYVGCSLPPPGTSFLAYDSLGVPSGGTDVGATQGEAKFTYKATIEGVDIEQSTNPVAPHITTEEATITFTVAEATAANIYAAIGAGGVYGTTATGPTIRFGGITASSGTCVALVGEQATSPGKYYGGMLYTAVNDAGLERTFKKGKESVISFTFKSFPTTTDLGRPAGEQLGQWAEEN